ncbi:MAG: TIGR02530 family flagellar biosynthesis protein [Dehalococcoidia bacterium]
MAEVINGLGPAQLAARELAASAGAPRPAGAEAFRSVLDRTPGGVAFSGHAARRMEQRGVHLDEAHLRRIDSAVDQAQAKGSRDSLILMDDLALVVSITNRTVVTAVDQASQKEHVFTNVDSVVIAP